MRQKLYTVGNTVAIYDPEEVDGFTICKCLTDIYVDTLAAHVEFFIRDCKKEVRRFMSVGKGYVSCAYLLCKFGVC